MPAIDLHTQKLAEAEGPATRLFDVVPSDTLELTYLSTALYVGTGGDIRVRDMAGSTVTLKNVASGSGLPIRVRQVLATGTTASNIVGMA